MPQQTIRKGIPQIHFLHLEFQIWEHQHLINTSPPGTRRDTLSLGFVRLKNRDAQSPFPTHKTSKSFSCLLHHTASLSGIFKHPWSTYQNIDLKLFRLVIQTTGNNNDHRSLDTRGPQDTSWGFTCAVAQAPHILSQSQHLGLPDQ